MLKTVLDERYVVLDCYVDSGDVLRGNRILEVCAMEVINGCRTPYEYQAFYNPECLISQSARIDFRDHDLEFSELLTFKERYFELFHFIGGAPLISFYYRDVVTAMVAELARIGWMQAASFVHLAMPDLDEKVNSIWGKKDLDEGDICERLGIPFRDPEPGDYLHQKVKAQAEIFSRLFFVEDM